MPRMGYLVAAIVGIVSAFVFSGLAGAASNQAPEAKWSCSSSVARLTLTGLPEPIEPITANSANPDASPCADDFGGVPTIDLPPDTTPPNVTASLVQASTDVLCDTDTPAPLEDPNGADADKDACDAKHSFDQQVVSRARAANVEVHLGSGEQSLDVTADVTNSAARAYCDPATNQPAFKSYSNVVKLTVKVGGTPIVIPIPAEDTPTEVDLGPLGKIELNERIVNGEATQEESENGIVQPDDAASGSIVRRAIHVILFPDATTGQGQIDLVVGESKADFTGDVCPEGTIVVKKQTAPDEDPNTTQFGFTSPGLSPDSFNLTDDGAQTFTEVLPGSYSVKENEPPSPWELSAIECADPTSDTTTTLGSREAAVAVDPGETVSCTFVNTTERPIVCPPGTVMNAQGVCVVTETQCPPGSVKNGEGVCVVTETQCPPGSTKNPEGQCVVNSENTVCPPGSVKNPQGQCVLTETQCPPGSVQSNGQCVVTETHCPEGSTKNAQGQCVLTKVTCPEGTRFDATRGACVEAPTGGRIVPLEQVPGHAGSPCRDRRFGTSTAIIGTNGPDRITGTNLSDRIFSLRGNDRVSGGRGNDCLEGDGGRDFLDGSNGQDYLLGGSGRDKVSGGPGRDHLFGGSGNDRLSGGLDSDVIRGGTGSDKIQGDFGNDLLFGGPGNDGIHTGNGKDRVFAGPGDDIINAATRGPAAFVDCGPGKDRVRINNNERNRIRNCEFVDLFRRVRSG